MLEDGIRKITVAKKNEKLHSKHGLMAKPTELLDVEYEEREGSRLISDRP